MISQLTVEEANEIKSRPNPVWKEMSKGKQSVLRVFQLGNEPEIVYIFKSGYTAPQMYHVIFEDGYESPIIHSFWTEKEIKEQLNIDL